MKVWGRTCNKMVPYTSWREMFVKRPRVRFDGKKQHVVVMIIRKGKGCIIAAIVSDYK